MGQPAPSLKILIVDDEPDTVDMVQKMLDGRGFEFSHAYDGDEALRVAHRFRPDVILLDVMMPEQDGWLVCAKLKVIPSAPKIIIFTVLKHGESDRLAQFVHADDIIHKPFTREQLLEKVTLAMGHKLPAKPAI
jgi:two-component system alkaline phosphatase synthesis response regulator PhoP